MTYWEFAANCARSILLFNEIDIYVITNLQGLVIPSDLIGKVHILPTDDNLAALGIEIKLYLDLFLQTEHTLFVDADCMCFSSLMPVFQAGCLADVTCAGKVVPAAVWCGTEQAKSIKESYGLEQLIRFNGGLYYLKKSTVTKHIYGKAREIAAHYDELGFQRIGRYINEEGPLSISMMLHHQPAMPDNGVLMTDLYTDPRANLNVLTGYRLLKNAPVGSAYHRSWYHETYSPIIVHYGSNSIHKYPYLAQAILLKFFMLGIPEIILSPIVFLFIHLPYHIYFWSKKLYKK